MKLDLLLLRIIAKSRNQSLSTSHIIKAAFAKHGNLADEIMSLGAEAAAEAVQTWHSSLLLLPNIYLRT